MQTLQERELPKPHNGACDRADRCRYASEKCRLPLPDYPLDWTNWQDTPLPAAPSRRWTCCAGWKKTLGMVYDKESGSWVYPIKPEHFGFKVIKHLGGGAAIVKKKEEE